MKFSVGLPLEPYGGFIEQIIQNKELIYEVYFSWEGIANGRGGSGGTGLLPWEAQNRIISDIKNISENGISLNLLLNAACYGAESQSRAFFNKIGDIIDYLSNEFSLASVTVQSPLIAKFVMDNFKDIETRASINLGIGTVHGMEYVSQYFDGYYLQREYNHDFERIRMLKNWCVSNGKKLFILANSGCLNFCSAHNFHDSIVSHENEAAKYDNAYQFTGVCREFLARPENRRRFREFTNFIFPEDIGKYAAVADAVKLATRVNSNPTSVLQAYLGGRYSGNICRLLEPNFSDIVDGGEINANK